MKITEIRKELSTILPENHPFLQKLETVTLEIDEDDIIHQYDEIDVGPLDPPASEEILDRLVCLLDDWKRGIRDWSEVEMEIKEARHELQHV